MSRDASPAIERSIRRRRGRPLPEAGTRGLGDSLLGRARRALVLALATATFGCGGPSTSSAAPERVLHEYAEAVKSGEASRAYALLDAETRARVSEEEFARLFRENRAELTQQADSLLRSAKDGVQAHARVEAKSGRDVALAVEDERWRIEGGILSVPKLRTPRDAVLSLRNALDRGNLTGVARVLARVPRAELEAEVEAFLADTEDELDLAVEVRGDQATIRTTSGREIRLIKEGSEWKILDVR